MSHVLWRILWIAVSIACVTYASYLFFGNVVQDQTHRSHNEVIAQDVVSPGEHHISGMIMVPSDCHGLSLRVLQTTPSSYQLTFQTWLEPYRDCPQVPSPRAFHAITFAPSVGADFSATLDGTPFPLQLLEQYQKRQ